MKSSNKMKAVMDLAEYVHTRSIAGDIVEAGVAAGGGVLPLIFYLACTGDLANRTVYLFDTWEGLPAPSSAKDAHFHAGQYKTTFDDFLKVIWVYSGYYLEFINSDPRVKRTAVATWDEVMSHLKIVKGLFADTMQWSLSGRQLALLMCDGDMYSSTKDCMSAGANRVVKRGAIYSDDYYTFKGCYDAMQEYITGGAKGSP